MPSFSIDDFKGALKQPARSHLFLCRVSPPASLIDLFPADEVDYLCKAVTLPAATVETTELSYFTRAVKIPGRRTYTPITLTFYNTERYTPRNGFEQWSNGLNQYETNIRTAAHEGGTYGKITLDHFSTVNREAENTLVLQLLSRYEIEGAFPITVNGLQFSHDADTEIQTFDVEFQYQYVKATAFGAGTYPEPLLPSTPLTDSLDYGKVPENLPALIRAEVARQEAERIKAGGVPFGKTTTEILADTATNLAITTILRILQNR